MNMPIKTDYGFDQECITTHWKTIPDKYSETLEKCSQSDKNPQKVIELFVEWIRNFVEENKASNIYLITDCAAFDAGILKTFSLCSTLKLVDKKSVRDIIDTTSFFLGVSRLYMTEDVVDGSSFSLACKGVGLDPKKFKSSVQHDHNPVNDATVIFEKYRFINEALLKK